MTFREALVHGLLQVEVGSGVLRRLQVLELEAQAGAGFLPAPGRPGVDWARSGPGLNNRGLRRVEGPRDLSGPSVGSEASGECH
jgi:hypothetical protein